MKKYLKKILCLSVASLGVLFAVTNFCPTVEASQNNEQLTVTENNVKMRNATYLNANNVDEWDFTNVIESIEYFTGLYPEKNDVEIADLVYDNLFVKNKYVGGLTPAEFKVIMNALGLSGFFTVKNIAEEVTQTTIEKYGINGYQDDSDAFRHIYLTCVLYDRISRSFAIDLMTAHESETADGIDKQMDLHNNSRGVSLYEKWLAMDKVGSLKDFISHCIFNGHFYNTKKIINIDGTPTLVFTENGADNLTYANKSILDLTSGSRSAVMINKDFQWYKFSSENKTGIFNVSSTGDVDLIVELFSSRTKDSIFIDSDDDDGVGLNFSLNFELSYYETVYIKVRGFSDAKSGDYQISVSEVDVTQAPTTEYLRYNKQMHYRVTAAGEKIREPHVVTSGAGRYTNCVLCGESLDTTVDGPFFVMYSLARKNSITAITTLNYPHIYLTKEEWKKYVEGTYFDGEKIV